MVKRFAAFVLVLLIAPVMPVLADDEIALRDSISADVQRAWSAGDFAALDDMAEHYASSRERTLSGRWRLAVFTEALTDQLHIEWPSSFNLPDSNPACSCETPDPVHYLQADQRWDALEQKLAGWKVARPHSPHYVIARALYLSSRGWFYRGSSYAQDVPQQAWPRLAHYQREEATLLQKNPAAAAANPVWFQEMFTLASDESWDDDRWDNLVRKFVAEGHYYPPAIEQVFVRLQPKWGGSFESMEAFARDVTNRTRAQEGGAIYTRLYWAVATQYPRTLFSDTQVDWPTMRSGFEDMIRQYPDPHNINAYGVFACMAGDYVAMSSALHLLGGRLDAAFWRAYIPYEECLARRAASQPH